MELENSNYQIEIIQLRTGLNNAILVSNFNSSLVQRGISHLANKNIQIREIRSALNEFDNMLASIRIELEELRS